MSPPEMCAQTSVSSLKVRTGATAFRTAECVPLPLCHTRALQRYVPSLWGLARVPASPDSQVLVRGTSAALPVECGNFSESR